MSHAKAKAHMKKAKEHMEMAHSAMADSLVKPDTKKGKMEAKSEKGRGGMESIKSRGRKDGY